jgi:hypothetical protein
MATATRKRKISHAGQIETSIRKIKNTTLNHKVSLYKDIQLIVDRSFRWQCAIVWAHIADAPHGKKRKACLEIAESIGKSERTTQRKQNIWKVFYQDDTKPYPCADRSYSMETMHNAESWFRIALEYDDPIDAIRYGEHRLQESDEEGLPYSVKQFKSELDIMHSKNPDKPWPKKVKEYLKLAEDLREIPGIRIKTIQGTHKTSVEIYRSID